MKKLMIAAAAVMMACAVNAAAAAWWADAVEYTDESPINSGTYWLVAMGSSSDTSAFKVYEDGTYDFGGKTIAQTGSITDAYAVNGELTGLSAANNGDAYALVIWDGLDSANGGLWGVSSVAAISGVIDEPPTNGELYFSNGTDSYGGAMFANKDVSPIPEPTSGLLLVLGMAGLALRRKRA